MITLRLLAVGIGKKEDPLGRAAYITALVHPLSSMW